MSRTVQVSKIFIVQSLPSRKRGEYLELAIRNASHKAFANDPSIPPIEVELIDVDSRHSFFKSLDDIKIYTTKDECRPMLHFEIHGDTKGFQLSNSEEVLWEEVMEPLRIINILSGNHTFISLATCYGQYILSLYSMLMPAPFVGCAAPRSKANWDDLETGFTIFFQTLIIDGNIDKALKALIASAPPKSKGYAIMFCEYYFDLLLEMYKQKYDTKGIKNQMIEKHVRFQLKNDPTLSENDLREMMTNIVYGGNDYTQFQEWRKIFLHQRKLIGSN